MKVMQRTDHIIQEYADTSQKKSALASDLAELVKEMRQELITELSNGGTMHTTQRLLKETSDRYWDEYKEFIKDLR